MTEELVAIPKSEYEYLLDCKRRLEEIIQERIELLNANIAIMKAQIQTNDIMTAIQTGCQNITQERRTR